MIVAFLAQLLVGAIIALMLFGAFLVFIQKNFRIRPKTLSLVTTTFNILFYCFIAYYFSKASNLYINEHGGHYLILILVFLLLLFLLNSPAKYAENNEQSNQILVAGMIGTIFFLVIRFLPELGEFIYGWAPVFIWV